jgi:hypothetical protein
MTNIAAEPPSSPLRKDTASGVSLRLAASVLVVVVWISAAIFGVYVVAFYGGAAADGSLEQWNNHLPGLYEPGTSLAAIGYWGHPACAEAYSILRANTRQCTSSASLDWPPIHFGRVHSRDWGAHFHCPEGHHWRRFDEPGVKPVRCADAHSVRGNNLERLETQLCSASGLGNPSLRACDRLLALQDGLWILVITHSWTGPYEDIRRAV